MNKEKKIIFRTHPSLAFIKYWGKRSTSLNIPATSSLAANLNSFYTETAVCISEKKDIIMIDGVYTRDKKAIDFLNYLRSAIKKNVYFNITSYSNFPASAGFASSSSGFSALTLAALKAARVNMSLDKISALARRGSASAARSVYSGIVALEAGERNARKVFSENYWPELRVLAVIIKEGKKPVSSRDAMQHARATSPFYRSWVRDSNKIFREAVQAFRAKDIEKFGYMIRASYMRMFSTMFSSLPPIMYWRPGSLALMGACGELRDKGVQAYETMDAGPQIKVVCLAKDVSKIKKAFLKLPTSFKCIATDLGKGPKQIFSAPHFTKKVSR